MAKKKDEEERKIRVVATNRKARHDYEVLDSYEAGIELKGSEVKSLRAGHVDLAEGYAQFEGGELWLFKLHIKHYQGSHYEPSETRKRKLLMGRHQLDRLVGAVSRKGMSLVPLMLYFSERGWAKVQLGLAKGRTGRDRREDIKKREARREMREARNI